MAVEVSPTTEVIQRVNSYQAYQEREGIPVVTGFAVGNGESVALLGPSGAGKTTLLRAAAGVLAADEGRLSARGRIASLLSVDAGLMPTLTGRENALLLSVLAGVPGRMRSRERRGVDGRLIGPTQRVRRRQGLHRLDGLRVRNQCRARGRQTSDVEPGERSGSQQILDVEERHPRRGHRRRF